MHSLDFPTPIHLTKRDKEIERKIRKVDTTVEVIINCWKRLYLISATVPPQGFHAVSAFLLHFELEALIDSIDNSFLLHFLFVCVFCKKICVFVILCQTYWELQCGSQWSGCSFVLWLGARSTSWLQTCPPSNRGRSDTQPPLCATRPCWLLLKAKHYYPSLNENLMGSWYVFYMWFIMLNYLGNGEFFFHWLCRRFRL